MPKLLNFAKSLPRMDCTDAGRDGSRPNVPPYDCFVREIRENRGPIPLVATGRAAPFGAFCGKSSQVPFNAQLTRHSGGSQSSIIKPNPVIFYDEKAHKELSAARRNQIRPCPRSDAD
jgi:hypothetical protein